MKEENNTKTNAGYNISAGIVVGYISEYLENIFINILSQENNILLDNNDPEDYLIAIIEGGVGGAFEGRISSFNSVVLATGIHYSLTLAIKQLSFKKVDRNKYILDFLIDIFFLYLLLLIYNKITKEEEAEVSDFNKAIQNILPMEILVSLYYAFKNFLRNKINQEKNKEKVAETNK